MATITPTAPTFTQVVAPVVVSTGSAGTATTLDLTTKRGAWALGRIGRRAATALTRPGYIAIRSTKNSTLALPNQGFDHVSSIAAAISNTLNGAVSIGAGNIVLTSATSFAIGDCLCLHSDDSNASRVEFVKVMNISSNTLYLDFNVLVAHNNADRVTTQADVFRTWIPGGDIYDIRPVNPSGQDLVFALDVCVLPGDTY